MDFTQLAFGFNDQKIQQKIRKKYGSMDSGKKPGKPLVLKHGFLGPGPDFHLYKSGRPSNSIVYDFLVGAQWRNITKIF